MPSQESLLVANRTFVTINLEAWVEGGCPIKKFIIECKQRGNFDWILITNEVIPAQKQYVIRDLMVNTSYTIRVSAISDAEVKRAEYEVTTADDHKGELVNTLLSRANYKLDITRAILLINISQIDAKIKLIEYLNMNRVH